MTTMTERQTKAWPEYVAALNKRGDVDLPVETHRWDFTWREEVRPGRGNDFSATYTDGEHFAQIMLDVYGNGYESVAELTWLHNSSDEECPCGHGLEETMALAELLKRYKDGDEHGWDTEFAKLRTEHAGKLDMLMTSIQETGIQEPILLGNDGRVWDGHHRLCAADTLGIEHVPVEYAAQHEEKTD